MTKFIARFMPRHESMRTELDRHYELVHTKFVRNTYANAPHVETYYQDRVISQFDLAGGWNAPLTAWRFVVRDPSTTVHRARRCPTTSGAASSGTIATFAARFGTAA